MPATSAPNGPGRTPRPRPSPEQREACATLRGHGLAMLDRAVSLSALTATDRAVVRYLREHSRAIPAQVGTPERSPVRLDVARLAAAWRLSPSHLAASLQHLVRDRVVQLVAPGLYLVNPAIDRWAAARLAPADLRLALDGEPTP